jgi:hypothetical protein
MSDGDDTYYAVINLIHPIAENNLRINGHMFSAAFGSMDSDVGFVKAYVEGTAQYAPFSPNPNLTRGVRSLFTGTISTNYEVEYDAEHIRLLEFSRLPSRFSCLYPP